MTPDLSTHGIHHHLLLISLDTLRADRLGCYGDRRRVTPHLDALSREAALFLNASSPATWTVPAHMSMLSGLHPDTHGCVSPESGYPSSGLPFPLLFELLEAEGYDTLAITGGQFMKASFGFGRGNPSLQVITSVDNVLSATVDHLAHSPRTLTFLHTYMVHDFCRIPSWPDPLRLARQWVPDYRGYFPADADLSPLLAALALADHPPTLGERDRAFVDALYCAAVQDADGALGHLFDGLREKNLWESTTVVVTADHGESLGEVHHGRQVWSHGGPPFQEQTRVPLLVKPAGHLRGLIRPGTVVPWVSLTDLVPTLLELGGASSSTPNFDGRSLLPLLTGREPRPEDRSFFFHGVSNPEMTPGPNQHPASAVLWEGRLKVYYRPASAEVGPCYLLDPDPTRCEVEDQRDQVARGELEAVGRAIRRHHERCTQRARAPGAEPLWDDVPARALVKAPRGLVLDRIMTVEGLCTRASMEAMIAWARSAPRRGLVVELGTYRGRSAAALCHAVGDGRVVTIDDWSMSTFGGSDLETARRNLAALGYYPRILTGASHQVPEGIDGVAMLVIDSTHEGDVLRGELKSWWPLLRPDCVVAMHDYERAKFPSLVATVDHTFTPPGWERLGVVDFMIGFRRRLPRTVSAAPHPGAAPAAPTRTNSHD